jgi:hypothetical protein
MATFPSGIYSHTTLYDNVDDVLASHPNTLGGEINALETKVGVTSSSVATTIDYFLKHASGAYRTHKHDGTSDDGDNIPDTSLNQITTASKVSGTALTLLANIPAGAGDIPSANLGNVPFKTGDWIISTVITARAGWTNVSATYSNKFMRINATPLTTGGADTHTHAAGSYASPTTGSHVLTTAEMPAHTHSVSIIGGDQGYGGASRPDGFLKTTSTTDSTGGGGGHTHTGGAITGTSASADNVPPYVQVCIFQKN